ncbi:DegV family protein [Gynuella sunshinyii]|uniref:EDD domain protein, DegV family n=1 Tax=Gynuella sunshinyii YC6258 TaxID=1445510 RepID=A0A0C5VWN5_9GAMM|nr:DegV family protein [Gynuella sunshinyii]AJQ97708.1 hypothetical protein YC6258_05680 [Gynuella sunshinyii YC6258]
MKCVVVVDSSCDLPQDYLQSNPILVLPLNFSIDGKKAVDTLSSVEKIKMYSRELLGRDHNVESIPSSPAQVYTFFMNHVVTQYDFALGQTVTQSRSPNYDNWQQASGQIQTDYHLKRHDAGLTTPFSFRVINSGTFFAGQGLLAAYTIERLKQGISKNQIRAVVEDFKQDINAFAVPRDVAYLRERARKKGDSSVGLLASMIGKTLDISPVIRGDSDSTETVAKIRGRDNAVNRLFDYTTRHMQEGLSFPVVCISIADEPATLTMFAGFDTLLEQAKAHGVKVLISVMGMAGGINLGPGSICISFASKHKDYDF